MFQLGETDFGVNFRSGFGYASAFLVFKTVTNSTMYSPFFVTTKVIIAAEFASTFDVSMNAKGSTITDFALG